MFVSDLCRSIWVDYETEVEVQGVKAYRYRPPKDVFDMSNGDNFCYCPTFLECACPDGKFHGILTSFLRRQILNCVNAHHIMIKTFNIVLLFQMESVGLMLVTSGIIPSVKSHRMIVMMV